MDSLSENKCGETLDISQQLLIGYSFEDSSLSLKHLYLPFIGGIFACPLDSGQSTRHHSKRQIS